MFVDVTTIKKYQYVRILKAIRVKGKPTHKIMANLGNLEKLKPELPKILRGLHRLLGEEYDEEYNGLGNLDR